MDPELLRGKSGFDVSNPFLSKVKCLPMKNWILHKFPMGFWEDISKKGKRRESFTFLLCKFQRSTPKSNESFLFQGPAIFGTDPSWTHHFPRTLINPIIHQEGTTLLLKDNYGPDYYYNPISSLLSTHLRVSRGGRSIPLQLCTCCDGGGSFSF